MALHRIRKGLDLPISGEPKQEVEVCSRAGSVAVVAADYIGMKPTMAVKVGDAVRRGQLLFEDKKTPGVLHTSPGAGTVTAVNRGEKRALQSVVIELSESERSGEPADADFQAFEAYCGKKSEELSADAIRALLIESGMWTALRSRPFGRNPAPDATPGAILVNAMDTNPLAADPRVALPALDGGADVFQKGLSIVAKLTEGPTYVCRAPEAKIPVGADEDIRVEEFAGPHPAGLSGTHTHLLAPVDREHTVWFLGYQDVVAIARLFMTGRLPVERVVALAGPQVKNPRLLKTRMGASIDALVEGELEDGENRVIAGSVLSGRTAMGDVHGYLGRFDTQVSVIAENREREFLGWAGPGARKYSTLPAFLSNLLPKRKWPLTTTTNGSPRAIVPIGMYERVMPLDILPTFLLRSLCANDIETAEKLGALELIEEDLALCSFVCPSKQNYGSILRRNLTEIESEL